jgi:putative hydrolase of the HAD superfamily
MIRAVLMDFGETLVERVSDRRAPLTDLETQPFPETLRSLDELKKSGLLLAVVSNTDRTSNEEMSAVLERHDMRKHFTAVVTSTSAGVRKPHAAIYKRALDDLYCSPLEAVMVGDDVEVDLVGAAALGMATIHVNRRSLDHPSDVPTTTVSSLLEVEPWISSINLHTGGN